MHVKSAQLEGVGGVLTRARGVDRDDAATAAVNVITVARRRRVIVREYASVKRQSAPKDVNGASLR